MESRGRGPCLPAACAVAGLQLPLFPIKSVLLPGGRWPLGQIRALPGRTDAGHSYGAAAGGLRCKEGSGCHGL